MHRFLLKFNLSRLSWEEIEIMNKSVRSTEIKTVIKHLPQNKSTGPDCFPGEFYQIFRDELRPIILKLFQSITEEGTLPNLHSVRPQSPWSWNQIKDSTKKRKYRPVSLMNIDAKILNKILANRIQQHIKKIMHHGQVRFISGMQGFLHICKLINVIYTILQIER